MSEASAGGAETADRTAGSWRVREAEAADAAAAASGIAELLVELGGEGPSSVALEEATRHLIEDPGAGVLLVAEADDRLIGVLAASWQFAVHVPGHYGTIQDLWVHPEWRSKAIGRDLMEAFCAVARRHGAKRIEVGLPREDFPGLRATEAFYLGNGFVSLGPRMRRVL
jgi:branched-chain amino acid aminotransferase